MGVGAPERRMEALSPETPLGLDHSAAVTRQVQE